MSLYALYQNGGLFVALLVLLSLWELTWKGFALWRAARKESLVWFAVLLVFNTAGILPILYLFVFSGGKKRKLAVPVEV